MTIKFRRERRFGKEADQAGNFLTTLKMTTQGMPEMLYFTARSWALSVVNFGDLGLALVLGGQGINGRGKAAAGTAPGSPEIDKDRLGALLNFGTPVGAIQMITFSAP